MAEEMTKIETGATGQPEPKVSEKPVEKEKVDLKTDVSGTPEVKKYKVKIEGKEEEVTEDELIKGYVHGTAANRKFQEAAMIRKQDEEFVNRLKTDPMGLLEDPRLGHNAREVAEQYLLKQIEKEMMTPEQRELAESKMKLAQYEAEKKAEAKKKEDEESQVLVKKYTEDYSKDILGALKSSGLPQTEHTVRRMAYYMYQGLTRGYDLKAADVVSLVRDDYKTESKSLFDQLDGQTLMEILGENVAKKIRSFDLSKIKKVGNKVPASDQGKKVDGDNPPKAKKLSVEEWKKEVDKRIEG